MQIDAPAPLRQPVDGIAVARPGAIDDRGGDADQRQRLVAQPLQRFAGLQEDRFRPGEKARHAPARRGDRARELDELESKLRGNGEGSIGRHRLWRRPVESGLLPYRRRPQGIETGPQKPRPAGCHARLDQRGALEDAEIPNLQTKDKTPKFPPKRADGRSFIAHWFGD